MADAATDWDGALARARAEAPFLAAALDRRPDLAELLARGAGEAALDLATAATGDDVGTALRRQKLGIALTLAIGDLAGAFPLARVMTELSAFADRALDSAMAEAVTRGFDAAPAGMLALALGKHGAGELNYSSDIDPILLYDPERLPRRPRDEPGEAANRAARRVVETLGRVDAEGYVFRVDLRLRPASEVSPLAIPVEAALTHYESSALAWERAAFIRARACAGDIAAGEAFLAAIRPFVWRRSLDFGTIADIARLTARIRANHAGAPSPGPGYDLKRGRGGIREVEFYAQIHQLIHGGRDPELRQRGTRAALDALAAANLIPPGDAEVLGTAYDRLRVIEHRLQMVADQQTHSLPGDSVAIDAVARLDGLADGAALVAELTAVTEAVGSRYDALIASQGEPASRTVAAGPVTGSALAAELAGLGFADPAALAHRIEGWRGGRLRALRSEAGRAAFDAVRGPLLAAFAAAPEPDRALARFESLLAGLPSAVNLFNLLEARPALTGLLARVLGLAPPLADELARRADLLDPLIDARAFDLPGSVADLAADFAPGADEDDYQAALDRVRLRVGEQRFALGVQLIEHATDPLAISEALARVAEAAIVVLTEATEAEFVKAHGHVPGGELVVLGFGRMGGGALTHASDLDLVFVFTGDHGAQSDGDRALGATLYFNRLAQRIVGALSVPTAAGALYEVDTRLRPSGAQGPLAVSLASFARYQREQAWTWEHMALARARPVAGSPGARAALADAIAAELAHPREPDKLRADVLAMRAEMQRHKPARGPLDVKLMRGGLVDAEFLIHYLQLRERRGLVADLDRAAAELAEAGFLDPALGRAQRALTRVLVAARLLAPDAQIPPPAAQAVLAASCCNGEWEALMAIVAESRAVIAAAWRTTFGEALEGDTA
ncbi:bifunctional [glutamate--ammonia ligase]-adenylyl-L-tyrosine phosphorylase/[glutamate--ammonia-ligase] adenylyltransferase [Parablastomonas sp. CN1-191]|uniref:bifunctional [glutamate--ammonia ligase]-adenylyl-L-tyrosine phosphorylase/[glutamate--ammonia-ligase] adenylyltransferase n=1 Tax=Parablastomonas sp. CN1-191 TaxID=3400908 RepID=UPI003BF87FFD